VEANQRAPVYATGEVEIAADLESVWDVLAAIDRWPEWNPDVRSASMSGPLAKGSQFRWRAGPGMITSTLQRVERPHVLGWSGKTLGIHAIHAWHLEGHSGKTIVSTYESWEGLPARLFRGSCQKTVERAIGRALSNLKAEAEQRAADS
jgi:uncharacterized protein YndB with AHSA1/START domain